MRAGFILLIFLTQTTLAQFNYVIDQTIPVSVQEGTFLSMPWAGGLNATQFNTLDLNGDGNPDLAIYDRTSEKVSTFINDNNQYRYAPQYELYFPQGITNWMLLRDYNGDGKKDIFTGDNLGIKVYRNTTTVGGPPSWEQFYFFSGVAKSPVLITTGFSGKINLQLNGDDLPSISDYDGDGDLDIFVPRYPGGSTIEYHKNLSVENAEPLDSLDFARTPQTPTAWGGVTECDCGEFAFHDDLCDAGGRIKHAGGKSLLAFDVDNDGDQDMLLSESECSQLFLLRNEGTNAAPVINTAVPFPTGTPATILNYPTAFYEDVDFDGVKDLIATPNIFAREFLQTNFKRSVWFYKNTGTTAAPIFATPNRTFLQERMIEVGDNAVPAFYDADGDSDLDLFIGCYSNTFYASMFYFENVGTQTLPSFKLISTDYLSMSFLSLTNLKPSFADINSDGKIDLVFTGSNQFGTNTQLYYAPNLGGSGINFGEITSTGVFMYTTENVLVIDINLDGLSDLLIGRQGGAIEYWRNTTGGNSPTFKLEDDSFLGLTSSVLRQNPSCTVADLDSDGNTDLIIGDQAGKLTVISDFRNVEDASGAVTNIIFNGLEEGYVSQNLGGRIWPTVANIFKASKPAIIVGSIQGGLLVLKHDESFQLPETPIIDVYPNPVARESNGFTVRVDRPAGLVIFTSLGQQVGPPAILQTFRDYNLSVAGFSKGVYIMHFTINGKTYTRKVVVY
jgi:hypothetical protein